MGSSKKHKDKDRERKHKRKHRSRDRSRSGSRERRHRDREGKEKERHGEKRRRVEAESDEVHTDFGQTAVASAQSPSPAFVKNDDYNEGGTVIFTVCLALVLLWVSYTSANMGSAGTCHLSGCVRHPKSFLFHCALHLGMSVWWYFGSYYGCL